MNDERMSEQIVTDRMERIRKRGRQKKKMDWQVWRGFEENGNKRSA